MKYVIFLMMLLVLAACGSPITRAIEMPAPNHVSMAQVLKSRAVALVAKDRKGEFRAYCSGVWVGPSTILTAQHCVDGDDYVNYVVESDVFAPGEKASRLNIPVRLATVFKRDEDHDLAVLTTNVAPQHDIAPIFTGDIVQGQGVQCLGQPLGMWFSYSSGEVAAVRVQNSVMGVPMLFVQAAIPISPGSSGGGLFDENGNLLGITHGSYTEGQMINLFIHAKYILALVK